MKLIKWCGMIAFSFLMISHLQADEQDFFFNGTVDAARSKAKKENKLYFIEFYAKWCEPCKWMDENTFTNPSLSGYVSDNYVPVKLDVENLNGFVWKQKYKVQYLPTIVVLNADGMLLGKYEKSMNARDLQRVLESHRGTPTNAETEMLARENTLAPATPVKTDQSIEAKPVFVSVKREPGLAKPSDVVKKPIVVPATKPDRKVSKDISDGNEYRIQTGVYSDPVNATTEVEKLKTAFDQTVQVFNKKNVETNVVIYRVTIGKFSTREEAATFAQVLNSKGVNGIIKHASELK